jgi:membrane protein DedA with SNARE-associated domain
MVWDAIAQFMEYILGIIAHYGGIGVGVGMFFESSFVPIPSELVFISAGAAGVPLLDIVFWGTIGSTLGAILGYYIGLKAGRPFVDKYGKYFLLHAHRLDKAEVWLKKYGTKAIVVSRIIPMLPYKVISIGSGILRFNFKDFIIATVIGTIPRAALLAILGQLILIYQMKILGIMAVLAAVIIGAYYWHKKRVAY